MMINDVISVSGHLVDIHLVDNHLVDIHLVDMDISSTSIWWSTTYFY